MVGVEKDVLGLEVAVDRRFRLLGVEEDQRGANLRRDAHAGLPCERRGLAGAPEAVLEVSVGNELVHEGAGLAACPDKGREVRMPNFAQNFHLQQVGYSLSDLMNYLSLILLNNMKRSLFSKSLNLYYTVECEFTYMQNQVLCIFN